MTEQEFIDYIEGSGTHVRHTFDDTNDYITKAWHLTPYDSAYTPNQKTTSGLSVDMGFYINGKIANAKECAELFTKYERDRKLKDLGINI